MDKAKIHTIVVSEEMKKKYKEVDFIAAGSSLKFCSVTEGMADVYPRFGPTMEWDTAAGQAIAEESGLFVTAVDTGERRCSRKEGESVSCPPHTVHLHV